MTDTASKATGAATLMPTNKVIAGGIAGALVTVVVFVLNTWVLKDNKIPADVASALTFILSSAAAYLKSPSPDQTTTDALQEMATPVVPVPGGATATANLR